MVQHRLATLVFRLVVLTTLDVLARPALVSAVPGQVVSSTLTTVPGATDSAARAVARQPDGRLLVAGTAGSGGVYVVVLTRHFPNGARDTSFGPSGFVTLDLGADVANGPVALVRRDDGTLVVAATVLTGSNGDFVVARLDPSGAADATFGVAGKRVVDFGGDDRFAAMVVDGTNRIVVAGGGGSSSFAVARLTEGGALDTTFSGDGKVTTDASGVGRASAARALAIDGAGRIVAVGQVNNGTDLDFALVVYDDLGVPDETFDDDGVVVTSLGNAPWSTNDDVANGVVVLPDDEIVVAGYRHENGFFDIVLARYETSGELDDDFGDDGVVITEIMAGEGLTALALLRDVSGRFVTVGHYVSNQVGGFRFPAMVRFEPDGTIDESFGGDDNVTYFGPTPGPFPIDDAYALVRDPYGHYVVVGVTGPFGGTKSFALSRISGDGPCVAGPEQGCLASTVPRRNTLTLIARPTGEDRLLWRWRRGEETARVTFGNPVTAHDYQLCAFDGGGARVVSAAAPRGDCGGGSCWKTREHGFKYRDPERTPSGVSTVRLIAGSDGEASIRLEARGANLSLPSLPVDPTVTVQLHASNGVCWQAVYEAAGVTRNDTTRFVASGTR